MSASLPTVSARLAHLVLARFAAMGGDADALAAEVGVDRLRQPAPDERIPLDLEVQLWEEAARRLGDPLFGFRTGMAYRPGSFDVFDYVCRAAADLRGAIERVVRYNRLLHDVAVFELVEEGDRAIVTHRFRGGAVGPSPQAAGYTVAAMIAALRLWTGEEMRPRAVAMPVPPPAEDDAATIRSFLGTAAVRYGAPHISIEIDRTSLDHPLVEADPGLCSVLDRHAEASLAALPQAGPFEAQVRERIAAELRGGTPTVEVVASRLRMSPRTLHRRLAEAGTSFGAELEALRRGLAERYLSNPEISIAEVAFLLGYSEPRAFHRAFKSWTGSTPGTWRKERLGS